MNHRRPWLSPIHRRLAFAAAGASFALVVGAGIAMATNVQITCSNGTTEQTVTVTDLQAREIAAAKDCSKLLTKPQCVSFTNNCTCSLTAFHYLPPGTQYVYNFPPGY